MVAGSILVLLVSGTTIVLKNQSVLEDYFSNPERTLTVHSLLLTVGGSLIGATLIAFSLIMFAMQVNVERMPYGLFKKFSSDSRLLGAFVVALSLAMMVASLSLALEPGFRTLAMLLAVWGIVLTTFLLLLAYGRALSLISPTWQLEFVVAEAKRDLGGWLGRCRFAVRPLAKQFPEQTHSTPADESAHDLPRVAFFQAFPQWTALTQQAILYCTALARGYAEQGDYEISQTALNALCEINAAYVQAKGRTFFTASPFFENPLARDEIVLETLEHLRQFVKAGCSHGDERRITQAFGAMGALCALYSRIDYSSNRASKLHAFLSAGYLSQSVQSIIPLKMPDVLMDGVRRMGAAARLLQFEGDPNEVSTIVNDIAFISIAAIQKEDHRPVVLICMEQLTELTFDLIRSRWEDVQVPTGLIRDHVVQITIQLLGVPTSTFADIHSRYVGPYYSATDSRSLVGLLFGLVNELIKLEANDERAKLLIGHIQQWAHNLFQSEKEVLLAAVQKRSLLTIHIVHFIANVTKLLIVVSNAPSCSSSARRELRRSADWLMSVISWIPDDRETVAFVETAGITETLFEVALEAKSRDCNDIAARVSELLLSWTFKSGRHEIGLAILERGCYAVATLELLEKGKDSSLLSSISARLTNENAPNQEIRDHAARKIRKSAKWPQLHRHAISRIEHEMSQVEQERLCPLLMGIADLLSPGTADEPIDPANF